MGKAVSHSIPLTAFIYQTILLHSLEAHIKSLDRMSEGTH